LPYHLATPQRGVLITRLFSQVQVWNCEKMHLLAFLFAAPVFAGGWGRAALKGGGRFGP
jgi:hypothetical protein